MQEILLVIQLIVALTLVGLILIQRSEGGALGMGGSGMMSARSSANFLTRTTGILAVAFIGLTMVLAILSARSTDATSIFDEDSAALEENMAPQDAEGLLADTPALPEGGDDDAGEAGKKDEPTGQPDGN